MLNIITFLSVSALLLSEVSAGILQNRSPLVHALVSRQLPDAPTVPTQCESECSALNSLESCSELSCMCTSAIDKGLGTCLQCISALDTTGSSAAAAQQALSEFEQTCADAGMPIGSASGTTAAAGISGLGSGATASTTGGTAATGAAKSVAGSTTPTTTASSGNPLGKTGAAVGLRSVNVGMMGSLVILVLGGYLMA